MPSRLSLFVLFLFYLIHLSVSTCTPVNGIMPAPGSCEGPTDRVIVKLTHASEFNGNCPNGQVQYFKDDDPTQSMCGECVPGTAGVDDPELICNINQFCNDTAYCQDTKTSPLYNEPCPYEQGGTSSLGWCGPGLRCIHHVCLPCENGVEDPRDGKYCVNNQW